MKFVKRPLLSALAAVSFLMAGPMPAASQGMFAPAIIVNDRVITNYEIEQRILLMRLLRAPGDHQKLAREQLIEDRLKLDAVQAAGLEITEEGIESGIEEFAARANMNSEQFLRAIAAGGVAKETFRDFVIAGLGWRELVRAKFGPRVNISETDIQKALNTTNGGAVRVLLSEIIMPAPPPQAAAVQARAERISQLTSFSAFSAEARRYSATKTRGSGGRLPWMPLSNLPPALRPIILGLAPGQVSQPLPLQGAIALFQMREIQEMDAPAIEYAAIEYAAYYMSGGRSEATLGKAQQLRGRVDVCDDLYGVAKGQPEEVLERGSKKPGEIPTDIALELSKLDPGEVSTALTRSNGETLVFLMLCGRTTKVAEEAAPEDVAVQLQNKRLGSYAQGYLEELRAEARIIYK